MLSKKAAKLLFFVHIFLKKLLRLKSITLDNIIVYILTSGGNIMFIDFLKILLIGIISIIVYFNLIGPVNYKLFVNMYPYLLSFTVLLIIFLISIQFIKNPFIVSGVYLIMTIFTVFFIFTFFQVYRNVRMTSNTDTEKNIVSAPITLHNEALLIYDEKTMFDEMIEEIYKAKNHIHIEFFILRNDKIGQKLKELLIKKAKEGVEVRVIYDGIGSIGLKKNYIKELQKAGVGIKSYDGIWQSIMKGKLNRRNHRKIVIIDGAVGFTGGINIGDEYLGRDDEIGNWKDTLVKIKGEAVKDMQKAFLDDWHYISGEELIDTRYFPRTTTDNILPIEIVACKYENHLNITNQAYLSIIESAKENLYIVTPYLVLNDTMMNGIKLAVLRGVDVKIILPKNPDHFLVGWVNASFYNELLNSNVKVYLYGDGFLHSKIVVVDEEIVSVGSANFNMRSQYLDCELIAILFDTKQSSNMIKDLHKSIENSKEIILKDYNNRSLLQRIKEKLGILIRPLV